MAVVDRLGELLGVVFEQWLESAVVGLMASFVEPAEHVVSLPPRAQQAVLAAGGGRARLSHLLTALLAPVQECGRAPEGTGFSDALNRAADTLGASWPPAAFPRTRPSKPCGTLRPRFFPAVVRTPAKGEVRKCPRSPTDRHRTQLTRPRPPQSVKQPAVSGPNPVRADQSVVGPGVALTVAQWARLEPLLPGRTPKHGGRRRNHRR